jgi:hypothetical protein
VPRAGLTAQRVISTTASMARAAAGVTGPDSLHAISAAYRGYALACPGRYAASVRAPAPGDREHEEAAAQAVAVISAALTGYRLRGAELIHAIRMWRAACHGLVSLEVAAFGLPEALDVTFDRLIQALDGEFRRLGG